MVKGKKHIFKFIGGGTHGWSEEDFEACYKELASSDDILVFVDGLDEIFSLTDAEFEDLEEYSKAASVEPNLPTKTKQLVWAILNKVILPKASVVATSRPHTGLVIADKLGKTAQPMKLVPRSNKDHLRMLKMMIADETQDEKTIMRSLGIGFNGRELHAYMENPFLCRQILSLAVKQFEDTGSVSLDVRNTAELVVQVLMSNLKFNSKNQVTDFTKMGSEEEKELKKIFKACFECISTEEGDYSLQGFHKPNEDEEDVSIRVLADVFSLMLNAKVQARVKPLNTAVQFVTVVCCDNVEKQLLIQERCRRDARLR